MERRRSFRCRLPRSNMWEPWTNDTPYMRGHMIIAGNGFYQVLENHTTPALPAPFDPNAATDGTNPLYQLFMPLNDVNYDAAIFVPGSIQRTAGELLFQGIANRTMHLGAGDEGAYARLDVANPVGGSQHHPVDPEERHRDRHHHDSLPTRRTDVFNVPAATDFAEGDRYALRVTASANAVPAGLSVTLPFMRTDI